METIRYLATAIIVIGTLIAGMLFGSIITQVSMQKFIEDEITKIEQMEQNRGV